jgi:hypothetical protein
MTGARLRWLAAAAVAAASVLTMVSSASAASNVQVTNIDCEGHPRKIAITNNGDAAQSLAGWKLLSDKPNEVFDLGVAGQVAAGETFYVFNGHLAPLTPTQAGSQWIYGWNASEVYDPTLFVLDANGTDFIRLVDATGFPWRDVSSMPCPGTTQIPPLQQPATPTASPPSAETGAGGNTAGTDGNQAASAQTDSAQSAGASQSASASGNTTSSIGAGTTTAQTGNASGQVVGGPASGIGVLAGGSGQPLGGYALPLGLLGIVAGAVLALVGGRVLRRALRRP